MSSNTRQPSLQQWRQTDECACDSCDHEFVVDLAIKGSYCSLDCFYRDKGAAALRQIRHDHQWCATCFRRIKTVEAPPDGVYLDIKGPDHEGAADDVRNVIVGYQYRTEHTTWGTDDFSDDDHCRIERQRWSCECGNVDPSERDDILEEIELETIVASLFRCLEALAEKGALQNDPSWSRYKSALRDHWRDWEFAVGRALYE